MTITALGVPLMPRYQLVRMKWLIARAPRMLAASHQRWDDLGSSAGAAVNHTMNGSQMRSVSALLSMLRSAHRIAAIAASTNRCRPERRRIAAISKTRANPATLAGPIAHATDARFAQRQYWKGGFIAMPCQ